MEIEKLKVAELRQALGGRGLDTKGTKPVLVQRLKEAIDQDTGVQQIPSNPVPVSDGVGDFGGQEEPEALPLISEAMTVEDNDDDIIEVVPVDAPETTTNLVPETAMDESQNELEDTAIADVSAAPLESQEASAEEGTKEPVAKNDKTPTPTTSQNNNQQRRGQKRKLKEDEPFVVHENEPDIDEGVMCLDWFNSDLSMRIDKNTMMIGEPFHKDGWGYVWSGAKATHGFVNGAVWYEVKVLDELETKVEPAVHELRLGWSTDDTDMQLGEALWSFAYSGSAKKGRDCKFEDYGESFKKDDVVGAFLDLNGPSAVITFTKNGVSQGVAFEIAKEDLAGKALYPHVSSRNYKFEVNFGKTAVCEKDDAERPHYTIKAGGEIREPWFAAIDGHTYVALEENSIRNVPRIAKREDCEMIMLIGLPGCGKTTWVNKFVSEHPEKRYNVIGTAALVDKMKVDGESLKKHHDGKWDQLIQKCTRCLQEWLRMASQRRRNVVVDQTNVYPNAQKRKVRPFEGMIRKAIVIVPSDEDYKARIEAQEKEETKDVPDNAVMEMKANFTLPDEGEESPFKEITFVELQRDDATKLVEKYNKDAKDKGFGKKNENKQNKKMRGGKMPRGMMRMRGPSFRGMRGMPRPNMRAMMMRGRGGPFMRGGPPGPMRGMMRGMPPMRGGPMMMRGGPGGPPLPSRSGPMGPGPRDGGRMMNKGNFNKGGMKPNPRHGSMGNNRPAAAGNNRPGNMGNQRQGNMGNQRQGNMGNQNRMSGGPVGRGASTGNQQRNARGPMNGGGSGGQMNSMPRFSGNKFGGNQMRGGNQGGPSPWQQGSVPQQQQQQFHPQQQQQQRQYQQPQMMQQQPRPQQQPGNWGTNPAWGNQGAQGQMMGTGGGGGGYGNMGGNAGMNQGMRGMNQAGGMNQPWSGQMGNPQHMRQPPQQAWGGGGPNHQGGQGYPGSQQWGGFNR